MEFILSILDFFSFAQPSQIMFGAYYHSYNEFRLSEQHLRPKQLRFLGHKWKVYSKGYSLHQKHVHHLTHTHSLASCYSPSSLKFSENSNQKNFHDKSYGVLVSLFIGLLKETTWYTCCQSPDIPCYPGQWWTCSKKGLEFKFWHFITTSWRYQPSSLNVNELSVLKLPPPPPPPKKKKRLVSPTRTVPYVSQQKTFYFNNVQIRLAVFELQVLKQHYIACSLVQTQSSTALSWALTK